MNSGDFLIFFRKKVPEEPPSSIRAGGTGRTKPGHPGGVQRRHIESRLGSDQGSGYSRPSSRRVVKRFGPVSSQFAASRKRPNPHPFPYFPLASPMGPAVVTPGIHPGPRFIGRAGLTRSGQAQQGTRTGGEDAAGPAGVNHPSSPRRDESGGGESGNGQARALWWSPRASLWTGRL